MSEKWSHIYDCIIVGAGISGLLAARRMMDEGWRVLVLEKGRGLGGRMATRRMGEASLDHGAQFFTVREPDFEHEVESWVSAGCATGWFGFDEGKVRYCSLPSMTGVAKYLAQDLEVRREHLVNRVQYNGGIWCVQCGDNVFIQGRRLLLTMPVPQAVTLLENNEIELAEDEWSVLRSVAYRPCIAMLVTLAEHSGMTEPGILKIEGNDVLQTIVDNQLKGISSRPALTLHATYEFSEKYLEHLNEETADCMWEAAKAYVDAQVVEWQLHRWRYAHAVGGVETGYFETENYPLWFAGDGWGGARVEGAALSGMKVANAMLGVPQENNVRGELFS